MSELRFEITGDYVRCEGCCNPGPPSKVARVSLAEAVSTRGAGPVFIIPHDAGCRWGLDNDVPGKKIVNFSVRDS